MGLKDLKKELKTLDKNQLIALVGELYKKHKSVKEYLDFYVQPNENKLLDKYEQKVFEAFYPNRGYDYNLRNGKKAISEFKKFSPSPKLVAHLMLFYVETGVKFTNDYGDINESFYSSIETTYDSTLKLIDKENLLDEFADRASKVVRDTDGIGWGFHDYLYDVYADFYKIQ